MPVIIANKIATTRYATYPPPRAFFIFAMLEVNLPAALSPSPFLKSIRPHWIRDTRPAPIIIPCGMYLNMFEAIRSAPSPKMLVMIGKLRPKISIINPFVLMIPITIDPTPRAVIAAKSPNQETPRRSVGIPIILPPTPMTIPTMSKKAFFPFSTTARIDSADATPGGHAPSAGNISLSNVL